jgi:hypothetical protein
MGIIVGRENKTDCKYVKSKKRWREWRKEKGKIDIKGTVSLDDQICAFALSHDLMKG